MNSPKILIPVLRNQYVKFNTGGIAPSEGSPYVTYILDCKLEPVLLTGLCLYRCNPRCLN